MCWKPHRISALSWGDSRQKSCLCKHCANNGLFLGNGEKQMLSLSCSTHGNMFSWNIIRSLCRQRRIQVKLMLKTDKVVEAPVKALLRAQAILEEASHQLDVGEYSFEFLEDAEILNWMFQTDINQSCRWQVREPCGGCVENSSCFRKDSTWNTTVTECATTAMFHRRFVLDCS